MEKDIREQIALVRYAIISPVLAEPGRVQNQYFREQAEREHEFPRYGRRRLKVSTMKAWLRKYRKEGFEGLKPKTRSDGGRPRRLNPEMLKAAEVKAKAYPFWSVQRLYEDLCGQGLLGDPPVHYNTLLRVVKAHGWLPAKGRTDVRKSFETAEVNELWLADFLHGPPVRNGTRSAKAILCAIIDDHSRMIVGHGWGASETISSLTVVLKEAFLAYGIPKRLYVDNGPSFSCDLLARSCALAGISLIHSKPYDSPSRGKVERFFRSVRERFLTGLHQPVSLQDLQEAFALWLQDDYHHKIHRGIDQRPIDRYQGSSSRIQIRRLTKEELDEIFLVRHERVVNHDATISFKGCLYEVPAAYIRQRIEIRHPVDDPAELYLYDNGIRVGRIKLLDKKENARTFRPRKVATQLSFARGEDPEMNDLLAWFALKRFPFDKNIKPAEVLQTEPLKEAFARFEYIKRRGGILLLTGDPGVGKTLALRTYVDGLNGNLFRPLYTPLSTLSRADLLYHLNRLLGLPSRLSKSAVYAQIQKVLLESKEQAGKTVVLILDEAHLLQTGPLEELRLLTNFKMDSYDPFILILAGQSDLRRVLEFAVMEPFNQRIAMRYHLPPLSLKETKEYVTHHLKLAGAPEPLLDEQALDAVHEVTFGIPRKIGAAVEQALTYALFDQKRSVTAEMVLKVKNLEG